MQILKAKKGFSIGEVPTLAIMFGVVAVVLGLMATILTQIQGTQTVGTYAYNVTVEGLKAQNQLAGWQVTWAIIVASAVVLGIISAYLLYRG